VRGLQKTGDFYLQQNSTHTSDFRKEWLSPHEKQHPTRETMDLSKLPPFGIPCWVYQKKTICDKGYSGKSDKKKSAVKGRLVGYNDSQGPLHVEVSLSGILKSFSFMPMQ
jgi:hypothetical protein